MSASKTPIALLVDDSCPLIHVFRFHWEDVHKRRPETGDGRPLLDLIPNDFLKRFCDVVERHQIAGKLSIVPSPGGCGDVVHGIVPPTNRRDVGSMTFNLTQDDWKVVTRQWIEIAKSRLAKRFDFSPEGITHNLTVDLVKGVFLDVGESDWSQTQSRATLMPYLSRSLQLLRDAGIDCTGVTSPWVFGIKVESEYVAAIVAAQKAVYGRSFSWYFLHMLHDDFSAKPWIAHKDGATLVSIPSTVDDYAWATIDSPRTDDEFIMLLSDKIVEKTRQVLVQGGWPVWLMHWQSLWSNGLETGLRVLDESAARVDELDVEWMSCMQIARRTLDHLHNS